jgi:hypothetical protein
LFQAFLDQANKLSIPREDHAKYVKECFERLERQREREQKQKELEERTKLEIQIENTKQKQIEMEAATKQKQIDMEAATKQKELDMQREVQLEREKTKQHELNTQAQGDEHSARTRTERSVGAKPIYPKLPMFREKQDDIDSYLFRFEAHATSLKWEKSQWVTYLSTLLEGNSLSLYHSLSATAGTDPLTCEVLKENLLKKFQCTADGFRKRFREARPDSNEPMQTYLIKLVRLFERWLALSEHDRTLEGIMELIVGEQFLESLSCDLATFIR